MFKIAIIGRPNVGKSTFFNKLVGRSIALVDDLPGVTRDRKQAKGRIGPLEFIAIDTAGLENEVSNESIEEKMFAQTQTAILDADLCFFLVDGKEGVVNKDFHFAKWLKKLDRKTILLVNKCENLNEEVFGSEYYKLGFGKPIAISAEHKLGFGDLYEAIAPEIEKYLEKFAEIIQDEDDEKSDFQVAIVGRPNAGKSTFMNKILGQDRLITGPQPGITRDAISVDYFFQGQKIKLIDTAGIRKKTSINQKLEKLSTLDSFRAIRFAQVVILLIDANSLLDHQDVALAGEIIKEGRGLIFAINKIDTVTGDKESFLRQVRKQIQDIFPEIDGAAILGVCAKTGYNVPKALEFSLKTYEQWQIKISTKTLNEWLESAALQHAPKLFKGKTVKLKYISQIKTRPPTFVVFTNHISPLEGSYQRYLINSLRKHFDLSLTVIRLFFRKSENPFANKKEKTFSKKTHKK
jgi:GTP-binding protein